MTSSLAYAAARSIHKSSEDNAAILIIKAIDGLNFFCDDKEAPLLPGIAVVGLTFEEASAFAHAILEAVAARPQGQS